jgi:hypothetical protein
MRGVSSVTELSSQTAQQTNEKFCRGGKEKLSIVCPLPRQGTNVRHAPFQCAVTDCRHECVTSRFDAEAVVFCGQRLDAVDSRHDRTDLNLDAIEFVAHGDIRQVKRDYRRCV